MTTFDLRTLRLRPSDERRIDREVDLQPLSLGGQEYLPEPQTVPTALTVTQAVGGRLLNLRFQTRLSGPCMRCLAPAALDLRIRATEYDDEEAGKRPGEDTSTIYVVDDVLELSQWAHDEVALALPEQILCTPTCAGICPDCGKDLNVEPHTHEDVTVDPRWEALADIRDQLA